ncbi:MAG: hypothetical protein ABFQ62_01400 [Patescibacteria group bacterium]
MKRSTVFLFVLMLPFLAACGGGNDAPPPTEAPTQTARVIFEVVTATPLPTSTPTNTPTNTPTHTPTNTPTPDLGATVEAAVVATLTALPTPTYTPTSTPTDTPTSTPTDTPTNTPDPTPVFVAHEQVLGRMGPSQIFDLKTHSVGEYILCIFAGHQYVVLNGTEVHGEEYVFLLIVDEENGNESAWFPASAGTVTGEVPQMSGTIYVKNDSLVRECPNANACDIVFISCPEDWDEEAENLVLQSGTQYQVQNALIIENMLWLEVIAPLKCEDRLESGWVTGFVGDFTSD